MLFDFHSKFPQNPATYSVTGMTTDGILRTKVVIEKDVEALKSSLSSIHCEFIYSIHMDNSENWEQEVALLDFEQFSLLLSDKSFLSAANGIGGINGNIKENVLLSAGERVSRSPLSAISISSNTINNTNAGSPRSGLPPKGPSTNSIKNSFSTGNTNTNTNTNTNSNIAASVVNVKVPTAVSSFFSSSSTTSNNNNNNKNNSKTEKKTTKDNSKPNIFASSNKNKNTSNKNTSNKNPSNPEISTKEEIADANNDTDTNSKSKTIIDDDDEEWDDGSGYKPKKSNLSKRNKTILDDEEMWENTKETPAEESVPVDPMEVDVDGVDGVEGVGEDKTTEKKKKKPVLVSRGAMDDYVNDHTFEGDDVVAPTVTSTERKKKLVEKVSTDAKGYLITEMVWEDMTPEEEAAEALAVQVAAEKKAAAIAASAAAALKKASAPSTSTSNSKKGSATIQQKGMMSFFGKKS